jgi:hypothetical protein
LSLQLICSVLCYVFSGFEFTEFPIMPFLFGRASIVSE